MFDDTYELDLFHDASLSVDSNCRDAGLPTVKEEPVLICPMSDNLTIDEEDSDLGLPALERLEDYNSLFDLPPNFDVSSGLGEGGQPMVDEKPVNVVKNQSETLNIGNVPVKSEPDTTSFVVVFAEVYSLADTSNQHVGSVNSYPYQSYSANMMFHNNDVSEQGIEIKVEKPEPEPEYSYSDTSFRGRNYSALPHPYFPYGLHFNPDETIDVPIHHDRGATPRSEKALRRRKQIFPTSAKAANPPMRKSTVNGSIKKQQQALEESTPAVFKAKKRLYEYSLDEAAAAENIAKESETRYGMSYSVRIRRAQNTKRFHEKKKKQIETLTEAFHLIFEQEPEHVKSIFKNKPVALANLFENCPVLAKQIFA
ncbi:unnamed protein product [Orchesella dallaii]|uniref:Uncharacterized protein n=1 Tax=Orchesella dallaii TaxID=48710 RepID=A0ABP1PQE6_9HEXA